MARQIQLEWSPEAYLQVGNNSCCLEKTLSSAKYWICISVFRESNCFMVPSNHVEVHPIQTTISDDNTTVVSDENKPIDETNSSAQTNGVSDELTNGVAEKTTDQPQ